MDGDDIDTSSESLGSDGDDQDLNDANGNQMAGNDSLLDSSDSDDSDVEEVTEDMDVDEDAINAELVQINDQLAENPYSYELYGGKIKLLKKIGDLGKLRGTREKFSEMYPLSEQIWLDWLRDEIKVACTDEEKDDVEKLFDRGVKDYLCVELWLEYINFCVSRMGDENGPDKCRDVFERALGSCGIHVSMGSLIWDMYRDFEAALLGTAETEEKLQSQETRFISLCRRQLSVPLLGMRKTYEDLKSKIDVDENTESGYKKAIARLATLENWEAKLVEHQDKLKVYREYIEDEKKVKSNPARVQCLYERAIVEFPLDSSLWLEYLDYLSKNLKIDHIILDAANRASRNCSWDINIWLKYMNLVERFCEKEKTFDTIKSVFEKGILYCSTGEAAGTIWLKYLEYLRRKIDLKNSSEKEMQIFSKTFDTAEQHLLQLFAEPNDYISEILLFRARFETQRASADPNWNGKGISEEVNNLWKNIISRGYGQYAKTWLQYIIQEVTYGADVRKLRAHYNKAITHVKDDVQTISNLWINFERDNGDLASLQQCESKISSILAKNAAAAALISENYSEPTTQDSSTAWTTTVSKGLKRKIKEDLPETKKARKTEDAVDSDKTTPDPVFKKPFAPPEDSKKAEKEVPRTRHGELVKHDSSKDDRTVFLSNLAYTTEETEINNFFQDVGKMDEIRLVKDYKGRSKGYAYIFFNNADDAKSALTKDRELLAGRPAFVSKCDPDKSTRQKQFKYPTNLEKNKLFVKGLPLTFSADELRDLFKEHGDLKDCRLVTYRNGHSKGMAYVEYIDEACAKKAILKADGTTIGDQPISVALSNPPVRDSPKSAYSHKSSGYIESVQRRTPKAFVPRSLQIGNRSSTESGSGEKSTNMPPPAPKSNQDFRSMFLKQ